MNIVNNIRYLAKQAGIEEVDFLKDVMVRDDGDGVQYISEFNLDMPEPTMKEIEAVEDLVEAEINKLLYIPLRLEAYPPIGEQLDMLYKDKLNGTSSFVDLITSIKEQYPKG